MRFRREGEIKVGHDDVNIGGNEVENLIFLLSPSCFKYLPQIVIL